MKNTIMFSLLVSILVIASIAMVSAKPPVNVTTNNNGNPGSIWTTRNDCGTEQQDVNQYYPGEDVYINGKNFDADDYDWTITGQPGQASCDPKIVVASGTETVNETGNFCFNAYEIVDDDCGVYNVDFGRKGDNYNVIPEFGLFVGGLTILAAVGIFFFVRRK